MTQIRIVGVGGSFNRAYTSIAAMNAILGGARDAGAEITSFDIRDLALPHYEWGVTPDVVVPFITAIRAAHGMVWCSPLYHGSISGSFKNTLDWLELLSGDDPPYLTGKVVALAATAGGEQALQAINTMEFMVRALRGWTLPLTAPVARADAAFDRDGNATDPNLASRLRLVGEELVRAAARFADATG